MLENTPRAGEQKNQDRTRIMKGGQADHPDLQLRPAHFFRIRHRLTPLLHELRNVRIVRGFQPVLVALEDQPAFLHHHESGSCRLARPVSRRLQTPLFRIVAEIRHQVPILVPVGHHQGGGVADVALLDEQRHDGVGGDRIETRGGRIVEHQRRFRDHGARDGGAAPHAAGKLAGKFLQGAAELHEVQRLLHARHAPPPAGTGWTAG